MTKPLAPEKLPHHYEPFRGTAAHPTYPEITILNASFVCRQSSDTLKKDHRLHGILHLQAEGEVFVVVLFLCLSMGRFFPDTFCCPTANCDCPIPWDSHETIVIRSTLCDVRVYCLASTKA